MKTLWILAFILISVASSAQTSVISIKSHHGNMSGLPDAEDKFGEIMPVPVYDSLIRISGECVVQIGEDNGFGQAFRDTVCGHWYYHQVDYDKKKIRDYHGGNVTMIDFDKDHSDQKKEVKEQNPFFRKRQKKQSGKWLFLTLVLIGLGTYIARPALSWKK